MTQVRCRLFMDACALSPAPANAIGVDDTLPPSWCVAKWIARYIVEMLIAKSAGDSHRSRIVRQRTDYALHVRRWCG